MDLAQPLPVVTGWGSVGAALFCVLGLALAAGGAGYARVVRRGSSSAGLTSAAGVAALCAFTLACAWAAPAIFSSDVYAYAAYGELLHLGANPYAHQPLPNGVPIFDAAIVQWGNPPPVCVYGPLFVAISSALVSATAPLGTAAALGGMRVLSSAALVACAFFAYAAYRGERRQRLAAAATIALNPVAIWCAAEGHNDALALAIVLAGVAVTRRGHPHIGGFLSALAGTVKLPAVAGALPSLPAGGGLGAIVGMAAALALSFPVFAATFNHVAPHAQYAPQASLQALVQPVAFAATGSLAAAETTAGAFAACAAAVLVWMAARRFQKRAPDAWPYLALAGWVLLPNPYPWYGLWLAAIAAAAPGTRAAAVVLALTFSSALRYLPDAVYPGAPAPVWWIAALALLPFALLIPRRGASGIINRSP